MSELDRKALGELLARGGAGQTHRVKHFFYVPSREKANAMAAELRAFGFDIESRLGADNVNWLVLARHLFVPDEQALELLDEKFSEFAITFDGEYDGWEAEVRDAAPQKGH